MKRTFSRISFRNFGCTSRSWPKILENRNDQKIPFNHSHSDHYLNLAMPWWISPPLPKIPFTTFYSRKSTQLLPKLFCLQYLSSLLNLFLFWGSLILSLLHQTLPQNFKKCNAIYDVVLCCLIEQTWAIKDLLYGFQGHFVAKHSG